MPRLPSEQQRVVIEDKAGLFTVRACPGSGKTFTVAARLHRLLSNWQEQHRGIAVASFTNVAWKEIAGYLVTEFDCSPPSCPHFLGTLDSFINTFIFLPFGHLVMPSSARPVFTGPPHDDHEPIGSWMYWKNQDCNTKGCKLNEFTYDLNSQVIRIGHPQMGHRCTVPGRPCTIKKPAYTKHGLATQSDAVYFSLRVLQKYPAIAKAIAYRFPCVIVDEAQDTSAMQMAIIDLLIDHGLSELMLVGDPDQAIYEWREAEPSVFTAKCASWHSNSASLSENWRSSQRLCAATSRMASSVEQMRAVNPDVSTCSISPQIFSYGDEAAIAKIVSDFTRACATVGISPGDRYALTRSKELVNVIVPGTLPARIDPWTDGAPHTRSLARAKYLFDKNQFAGALAVIERAIVPQGGRARMKRFSELYPDQTALRRRGQLFTFLEGLPSTLDITIGEWVVKATSALQRSDLAPLFLPLGVKRRSRQYDYSKLAFDALFGEQSVTNKCPEVTAQTVHMAKGTSLDAVLVVLKRKGSSGPYYVKLLKTGVSLEQSEELRIVYVALTRAKRLLWLVVPDGDESAWREYLEV